MTSQNNNLYVPIRVEANYLDEPRQVASPLADFSKLPWSDGAQDYNFDQPFIGDGVVHQPFANEGLILEAGLHLHFIIPHFLGQHVPKIFGLNADQQLSNVGKLPAAPNRWLVTRKLNGIVDKQWVIDSDFVHKEDYLPIEQTAIVPYPQGKPYRYMGLKTLQPTTNLTVENLRAPQTRPSGSYFKALNHQQQPLTVLAYGDPKFSSFYPSCLGVFGFFDSEADLTKKYSYEIRGINYDDEDDLLNQTLTHIFDHQLNFDKTSTLQNLFKLELDETSIISSEQIPKAVFCSDFELDSLNQKQSDKNLLQISVGNAGTEALSAYVADSISKEQDSKALKSIIEDQLESVLLFSKLDHLTADTGPKFIEARHEKGFKSSTSGFTWKLVPTSKQGADASNSGLEDSHYENIDSALIAALTALNKTKQQYDVNYQKLEHLREQLYLDWNKYMQASYPPLEGRGQFPDPDHIRYFIQNYSFPELDNLIKLTGELDISDAGSSAQLTLKIGDADSLAAKVIAQQEAVKQQLTSKNTLQTADDLKTTGAATTADKSSQLELVTAPGLRYWQVNDPVILISGIESPQNTLPLSNVNTLIISIDEKIVPIFYLSKQIWTPFILDWEVDLLNAGLQNQYGANNEDALSTNFNLSSLQPNFIKNHYSEGRVSVFSGSVLMSTHTQPAVLSHIKSFFERVLKQNQIKFTDDKAIDDFMAADSLSSAFSYTNASLINEPAKTFINKDYQSNPCFTAWQTYKNIVSHSFISQSLSGFNEACIMRHKTAQLPIREPIGFEGAKAFTKQVDSYVNHRQHSSPIMSFDFNPIRSGTMNINRLRITDNFGLSHDIDMQNTKPVISEPLSDDSGNINQEPRIIQPLRLNFQALADKDDGNPICGWLMANYFDSSIAVFNQSGEALGYVCKSALWVRPPGNPGTASVNDDIQDVYLLNVVNWIIDSVQSTGDNLINVFQNALNNISPAKANLFDSKAMLMGRPMAVVRAEISFHLKDLPVLDQCWSSLLYDLSNCDSIPGYNFSHRINKSWGNIRLPYRLGEHRQLNDSLIGYWLEDQNAELQSKLYCPEVDRQQIIEPNSEIYSKSNFQTQWTLLNSTAQTLTMLLDPRGIVHATSGVLPTKSIYLETKYYVDVLQKLNMWFQVNPILQSLEVSQQGMALNLPNIPGNEWKWWDDKNSSLEVKQDSSTKNILQANQLLDGWLCLSQIVKKK